MIGEDAGEGRNKPAPEFANKFDPDYKLKSINIKLIGPCKKLVTTTPPTTTTTTTTTSISSTTVAPLTAATETSTVIVTDLPRTETDVTDRSGKTLPGVNEPTSAKIDATRSSSTMQSAKSTSKSISNELVKLEVSAKTGSFSRYTITTDLFTGEPDRENKLDIRMEDSSNSWIALDSVARKLYFMPTTKDVMDLEDYNSTYKVWIGRVIAKDNTNTYALDLKVLVQKELSGMKEPNHKFRMKIQNYDIKVTDLKIISLPRRHVNCSVQARRKSSVAFVWFAFQLHWRNSVAHCQKCLLLSRLLVCHSHEWRIEICDQSS